MRTLLRILLRLLLLLLLLGLLAGALGPFLISPNPAPGVADPGSVAPATSGFIDLEDRDGARVKVHYLSRSFNRPGMTNDADLERAPNEEPDRAAATAFVLLHGFTFNAFTWNHLLRPFADHAPVIAYDQIPYGLSDKPVPMSPEEREVYSKASALQRLFALMDAFGIDQAVLVGNSSGGTLALEAALARPDRVAGLILIAPWVYSKRPILPEWLVNTPQMQRLTLALGRYLGTDSPLLSYSFADPTLISEVQRALTGAHRLMAGWDLAWGSLLQRSLTDPVNVAGRLAEIGQPALVITGDADQVVPAADTRAVAEALPNATLVSLPGCGHLPQEECPTLVEAAIEQWLEAQRLLQTGAPGD